MARNKTQVEFSNFTRGLITEASPLNFPENASLDENNVNINKDGSRQRRFGQTWKNEAYVITNPTTLDISNNAVSSFLWKSANNDGDHNLGIVQIGKTLYFYDLGLDEPTNQLFDSVTLGVSSGSRRFSYAQGYGKLLVAVGDKEVYTLASNGSSISTSNFRLKIRDLFGVDDGLVIDTRPISLSDTHLYNLRNQGWPLNMRCAGNEDGTIASINADPISRTQSSIFVHPSNADLVWAARLGAVNTSTGLVDNLETYSPWELHKQVFGTTRAPQGKYIIDVFNRSDIRKTVASGVPTDITTGGVASVAAFAGRFWYAIREDSLTGGDELSPSLGNLILYSQATDEQTKWFACHARNDPTAENSSDPLATDGGFISLPESGSILTMLPLGGSLFVFATNGVWEIFGGETGFSATTQSVVKVTNIGVIDKHSVVLSDNIIAYWSESGIYTISIDPTSLRGVATNVTESTIQTYYDDIPREFKSTATGSYDIVGKQISWLFSLDNKGSDYYYDHELILDLVNGSFTKRTIKSATRSVGSGPYCIGHLPSLRAINGIKTADVTVNTNVVTAGGVIVTATVSSAEQKTKTSMYYVSAESPDSIKENIRIGGYMDFTFTDWPKIQNDDATFGNDAYAFLLTGYLTGGNSSIDKWFPYIHTKLKRTESTWVENTDDSITLSGESSCMLQAQWDWTNNVVSGQWSNPQQVYRLPRFFTLDNSHIFSFDVINTRTKIRGHGDAVSLKFSSEPLKDMYIYGWGVEVKVKQTQDDKR